MSQNNSSKDDKIIPLDLRIAADCKVFLKSIQVDCCPIKSFTLKDGTVLEIEKMTDEQLVKYANEMYLDFYGGTDEGGIVDTHIRTGKK